MTHELTHLDLFSGIGGFALAAGWAGFRTVGFSEVEPYACRVLAERWPTPPNLGDVRLTANFARFRDQVTVLTGGFPCQPWSAAGKRGGTDDDRHLWPAMLRVIETVRPTWIIGENVPGLDHMGQLDACCDDLESLGYECQPFEIPACAVDAPHLRDRLWIVANASGRRFSGAIEGEGEQSRGAEVVGASEADADTNGNSVAKLHVWPEQPEQQAPRRNDAERLCPALADATAQYRAESGCQTPFLGRGGEVVADTDKGRIRCGRASGIEGHALLGGRWLPEPGVGRVANGVSNRSHRLKGLGNAIVPQIPKAILGWIAQIERGEITA